MSLIRKFIVIDDDPLNNMISSMMIKAKIGKVSIKTFSVPEEGLIFIQNEYAKNVEPTILFLDINMPTLTGWEFLEQYEQFDEEVKKQISIYILSSSIDQRDEDKAKANKNIKGFISKPLDNELVLTLASV